MRGPVRTRQKPSVYNSGAEDGEHTVTIRMAEEQTAGKPEIVLEYA